MSGIAKKDVREKGALVKKVKKSVTDIRMELKRVTWPTWPELINYTVTVLAVCAVMGALIYSLDMLLSRILLLTLNIG
jgi:preprotein translocase subunit SecE